MKTGTSAKLYNWEDEEPMEGNIIYLRQASPSVVHAAAVRRHRRKNGSGADTFWNLLFVALCLSVLVVLFLH